MTAEPRETEGPVIRDKRRIDPETGQLREPRPAAPSPPSTQDSSPTSTAELEQALAERTADLQRLQAEYVNYKRRVDRDREVTREVAVASVLTALLPVLDDIRRAREHNELTGGFKAVAESLERMVTQLGLVSFGEVGDDFDPRIHEALMHTYADDVDTAVCQTILQVGYRFGDRIIRPARVGVAEPAEPPTPPDDERAAHDEPNGVPDQPSEEPQATTAADETAEEAANTPADMTADTTDRTGPADSN